MQQQCKIEGCSTNLNLNTFLHQQPVWVEAFYSRPLSTGPEEGKQPGLRLISWCVLLGNNWTRLLLFVSLPFLRLPCGASLLPPALFHRELFMLTLAELSKGNIVEIITQVPIFLCCKYMFSFQCFSPLLQQASWQDPTQKFLPVISQFGCSANCRQWLCCLNTRQL